MEIRCTRQNGIVAVLACIAAVSATVITIVALTYHTIDEMHVGVYHRFGALLNETSEPGWHLKAPWTTVDQIMVQEQVDSLPNLKCGTIDLVEIYFSSIDVVNELPKESVLDVIRRYGVNYDKPIIFQELPKAVMDLCSSKSSKDMFVTEYKNIGAQLKKILDEHRTIRENAFHIRKVRVPQPTLPTKQMESYADTELQKVYEGWYQQKEITDLASERRDRAVAEAKENTTRVIADIQNQKRLDAKKIEKDMADLDNQMFTDRANATTEAENTRNVLLAIVRAMPIDDSHIKMQLAYALSNTTHTYLGSIPNFFNSVLNLGKN